MTEKYCIENDFIAQKELAEIERYNSLLIWEENKSLRASVARMEEALPDPDKLEILARWFDMKYPSDANPEVQTDLREWAKKIRRALEEK